MDISSQEIESIVRKVLSGMETTKAPAKPAYSAAPSMPQTSAYGAPASVNGDLGVFDHVEDAIEAAWKAQRIWITKFKIEDRQRVIEAMRRASRAHIEEWCHKIVAETEMGRYEDKVAKHLAVINKTPGPECLTTDAISGDTGLMLEEYGPFGVIAAITPTTNPTETIINNSISMIAGGNTVVFNVHPRAKNVCRECLQVLNRAIIDAGGPENLLTMTKEPTMENVDKLAASPKIRAAASCSAYSNTSSSRARRSSWPIRKKRCPTCIPSRRKTSRSTRTSPTKCSGLRRSSSRRRSGPSSSGVRSSTR